MLSCRREAVRSWVTGTLGEGNDLVGERLEVGILGNEVGLAQQLDQRAAHGTQQPVELQEISLPQNKTF